MSRTIIAISFGLLFDVRNTPPAITVGFVDADDAGRETPGKTSFLDEAAWSVWNAIAIGVPMLDAVNVAIDTQAEDVREPNSIAARITAAAELEQRARSAKAAADAAEARCAAAAAELEALREQIAALVREAAP